MNQKYLISNIKFNNGQQYESTLPIEYQESSYLAKAYLRTELFNICDLTYDINKWPHNALQTYATSDYNAPQVYDINIYDAATADFRQYERCCKVTVLPTCYSAMLLSISDKEIEDAGSLKQAAFEQLMFALPVDLYYVEQ